MTEYDLDFLKENGFLETSIDMEDKYDTAEGDVKAVSYRFDSKNRLAYFDDFDKGDIASILKVLREMRNYDYYWFWKEGRIYAFRTFGENKQFIFNTQHSRKTEYIKSKKDKLSKFSSENPTALFEVKDVISLFYRRLWDLRLKLAKAIKGGFDDRERILAAQRLLDRLIFTYFIAEKGIIYGIDKRGRRQEVNARDLFKYLIEVSGDFHSLLNVLFFDYLNDSKKNDMPIKGAEGYSLFIPYLNGGLFRERQITTPAGESIGESELEIEGFDWKELIDALNEYNWIIDGYTDIEDEDIIGNLTPEILGHIYEKFVISVSELDDIDVDDLKTTKEGELKKGNKKIGAYYTPEVITKYIAENTIFPFVMDKLELDEKYENFIGFHEAHKDDADTLSRFNEALKDIKVLDPAVGSGAFPMAAADILFDWRRKCGETLDDYHLRRVIIINNLHGVDIMEGAVEICMLRLWLWLIAAVDTGKEIEALPNIDFNIFEGNSLIGYVNEKEIADLKPKRGKRKTKARSIKAGKVIASSESTKKKKLDQFQMSNWDPETGIYYFFQQRNDKIRKYRNASGERAERLRNEIKHMTDEFNELLDGKLSKELQYKKIEIDENVLVELKPFHWVMQFSDVFENGGFDVVVGNPPHGSKIPIIEKEIVKKTYNILLNNNDFKKSLNSLSIFTERAIQCLKINGFSGYVLTSSFARVEEFEGIRNEILIKNTLLDVLDIGTIFNVGLEHLVILYKKNPPHKNSKVSIFTDMNSISDGKCNHTNLLSFFQDRNLILTRCDSIITEIISEIECDSILLGTIAEMPRGITVNSKHLEIEKKDSNELLYGGNNLSRFTFKDGGKRKPNRYIQKNQTQFSKADFLRKDKIIYKNIPSSIPRIVAAFDKEGKITDDTCNNILLIKDFSYQYLIGLLNSRLLTFYLKYAIINCSTLTVHLDKPYFGKLIIKLEPKYKNIIEYFSILLEFQKSMEENISSFFDNQILDSLVYSLYFSSKFATNGIPTDLPTKISPHLEPINYDHWAQLEFKDELTGAEMKEKAALEKRNMAVIEKVYQRLKDDKEIQQCIQQIQAHPWVRVVEGD